MALPPHLQIINDHDLKEIRNILIEENQSPSVLMIFF